jgi:hypothetical protein
MKFNIFSPTEKYKKTIGIRDPLRTGLRNEPHEMLNFVDFWV